MVGTSALPICRSRLVRRSQAVAGMGWASEMRTLQYDKLIMETRRLKVYCETPSEIRNKSQMSSKNALNRADEL
jgi:hypothetical protein